MTAAATASVVSDVSPRWRTDRTKLGERLGGRDVDSEQLRQLPDRDGDPDARQESDEHGAGQEVRQKSQPYQPAQ